MAIAVRYPGRVCLLGEHCDWAGGASLAAPMPLGVGVVVEPATTGLRARSGLDGRLLDARWPLDGRVDREAGPLRFIGAAAAALHQQGVSIPPAELWITADLPAGRGFSSSAATCLATLDALARHAGVELDAARLAELAFTVEATLLGVPCGRLDPMACAAGAPVFLRWQDDGRAPLRRVAVGAPMPLVVGALGRPRDTPGILRALREAVSSTSGAGGRLAQATLHRFGALAEAGAVALERGDRPALGAALTEAQESYDDLAGELPALAAPALTAACRTLHAAGALGAKFSGAGGDGSVVALFDSPEAAADGADALRATGVAPWTFTLEAA